MPYTSADTINHTGRTVLQLRELLLKGGFAPGERISELPLVARLGVSRTPIRLALDRLANEGLLEVHPVGGFVVRSFTTDDIWDAIELRGTLEGTAARLAAERFTGVSEELAPLREYRDKMDKFLHLNEDSFVEYLELNEKFHASIAKLAGSSMLRRTLDHVFALPFAAPSALVFARAKLPHARELFIVGQEHHHALVESIEQRQGARAESIAREHARLSRRNLESVLTNEEILSCVPGSTLLRA